jgi:fibronectin-binding autotransporter adhesin
MNCMACPARAAVLTWSGTAGATWNTSSTGWSNAGVGTPWDSSNGPADIADFNTVGATPLVSGTVYVNGITLNNTANISGGTISLGGATPTITMNASGGTIGTFLAGSGGLTVNGSGWLDLSSPRSSYSGTTTVNGGTLQVNDGGNLNGAANPYTTYTINSGATLLAGSSGSNGSIWGDAVTINSGGNLVMNNLAARDAVDSLTMSGGTMQGVQTRVYHGDTWTLNGANTVSAPLALLSFASGADGSFGLNVNSGITTISSGITDFQTYTGTPLVKSGAGILALVGANTYSGATTISAGVLQIGNGGSGEGLASPTIVNNGALEFNLGDSLTYAGAISGSGNLIQAGTGTITLTGTNSIAGNMQVSSGTQQIPVGRLAANFEYIGGSGPAAVVQSGGACFLNQNLDIGLGGADAKYQLSGGLLSTYESYIGYGSVASEFVQTGGTHSVGVTMNVGIETSGTYQLSGGLMTAPAESISVDAQSVFTQTGGTNSVGALTVDLYGTLATYNLDGGLLSVGSMRAGGPAVFQFSGGTLQSLSDLYSSLPITLATGGSGPIFDSNGNSLTIAAVLSGGGGFQKIGAGTLLLTASNDYTGPTLISAGTLEIGNGGSGASIGGTSNIVNNACLVFNNSDSAVLTAAITGSGSLTKLGSGSLLLSASNSYLNNAAINGGTLGLSQMILSQASVVAVAAGADMNLIYSGIDVVAALYLNGALQRPGLYGAGNTPAYFSGTGKLQVLAFPCVWNVSTPYFGDWNTAGNWAGGVVPTGSGTIAVFNTVAGATAAITNVPITLGVLNLASSSRIDITGVNQGALVMQADPNDSRYGGISQINVSGGSLAKLNLPLTFDSPATISIAGGSTLEIGNPVNLNGQTVTETGGGTLQLDVNFSAASGTLQANAGVVAVGAEAIVSPALLDIAGSAQLFGSGTIQSDVLYTSSAESTFAGSIVGTGHSLVLDGLGGSLTLSGSNTYAGDTLVDAGTLVEDSASALLNGSSLTVGANASELFAPSLQAAPAGDVQAVPEPGTLALLGVALCGAAVYRRVRSRWKTR